MIRISCTSAIDDSILDWPAKEYDVGRMSFYRECDYVTFTFYYPEDEEIFRLKFGGNFPPKKNGIE